MRQKSGPEKQPAEDVIKDIRRVTRRHFSAEDKIRIVLEGLRGEDSIAELCRREGIVRTITRWQYRSGRRPCGHHGDPRGFPVPVPAVSTEVRELQSGSLNSDAKCNARPH